MNIKRLMNTFHGQVVLSIVLGLGLASLFRKVCDDRNCIVFNGPIISDIEGKTFKHGEKCYKYHMHSDKCDSTKRLVELGVPEKKGF
jgi:hypothetical protein